MWATIPKRPPGARRLVHPHHHVDPQQSYPAWNGIGPMVIPGESKEVNGKEAGTLLQQRLMVKL
jgi:hypothetical protein